MTRYVCIAPSAGSKLGVATTIKLNDEAALEQRLATLQNNEQVDRIRVFSPSKTLTRTTTWSES